ncbi:hypothetical protein [Puniceibacterium confluentis]|uniref:hypothetical protein n=1 Tax=Puniceibacterium confluentis TaxID=1958944 RepID=UPI0011B697BD|nr:hypothetical protein [Puniceibacterium confluentis]
MTARQIFEGLQDLRDMPARDAARAGFLEWAFALPMDVPPRQAAREALAGINGVRAQSAAAQAFVELLEETVLWPSVAPSRRGGRAGRQRLLH